MHRQNWDDLRFILAVAENGSVSAAARQLGVNHATVLRRIAAFEDRNGAPLFVKSACGYSIPADRDAVTDMLKRVREAVISVDRALRGTQTLLSGSVKITSTDSLCQLVLPGILSERQRKHPDLDLSLLSSNSHLDLARLSADIAVRPALKLEDGLIGAIAGELHFAAYDDGKMRRNWLGLSGTMSRSLPAKWMEKELPPDQIVQGGDSFMVLRELAALGQGKALLPCLVGEPDARLTRLREGPSDLSVSIWVASQADVADTARFRVVRALLAEVLPGALTKCAQPD
jgi:DNA-binding transcriptional LysR family regulator